PAARSLRVDRRCHDHRTGSFRQQPWERRGRGQPAEERRPKSMIARVLVRKNPQKPAGAKQLDRLVKSFTSIEELGASAGPSSVDVPVDITVPQALVRRADPRVRRVKRHELGRQFPGADVAPKENYGPARAEFLMNCI